MSSWILVSIGSGNGLLPDGTKPIPEPMLINHQWGHVAFTWSSQGSFAGNAKNIYPWYEFVMYVFHKMFCIQKINSLGPSDAIWRWRSWLTLVQVMACCLTAPSHYLNQCWLIISKVLWHSSEDIIIRKFEDTNQYSKIEDYNFKIT